jgi:hypothetical protein
VPTTFPPREPARYGWADLLRLVGAVRRLALDRSLAPPEALGRIRGRVPRLRPLEPVVGADDVTWLASIAFDVEVGGRDPVIDGR